MMLSSCGGGNSNIGSQVPVTVSGNWQFTMAAPADGSFTGGLQGGFLSQNNTAVTGAVAYSVALPANPSPTVCNSGSAAITGTITGQNVALTAAAGAQTFSLTGTLSLDGTSMGGSYNSTAGMANGTACGTAQTGLQWVAILVPPLTGPIQGSFHSTGGVAGLNEQDFLVSGAVSQAANTGASTAVVTGNLNFLNSATDLSDYPCFAVASVSGYISGITVTLQIVGAAADGPNIGQIGASPGSGLQPVTFNPAQNGYAVQSLAGAGYAVYSMDCGGGSLNNPADSGNICLAVNGSTACQQPITLTPSGLIFPPQPVGSLLTMQTITLTNTYGSLLSGLTLMLINDSGPDNFTETDTCGPDGVPSKGEPFELAAKQSCTVTIAFAPLVSCAAGTLSDQCPTARLTVTSPNNDAIFTAPITGSVSASAATTRGSDFGPADGSQANLLQFPSFTDPNRHLLQTPAELKHSPPPGRRTCRN
ncbi:MAG: hypothetical protein WA172_00040 [Terriglobales bacterium]